MSEAVTVEDVCILEGPGYGECWGCPVQSCVLWESPSPLSAETQIVALNAVERLVQKRTVIGDGSFNAEARADPEEAAFALTVAVGDPKVQQALAVQMAAEAAVQGLVPEVCANREVALYRTFFEAHTITPPSERDWELFEEKVDRARAESVAYSYGVKNIDELTRWVTRLRTHKLKPTKRYLRAKSVRRTGA